MGSVTIGVDSYDVLGTTAALATYANGSLAFADTFGAATATTRARAHVEATRLILLMPFEDEDNNAVATAEADVVTAAYELALAALVDPSVLTSASTAQRARKLDAGGASIEYFAPTAGSRFPPRVMALLSPLLESTTAGSDVTGASYCSGESACSDFDECDRYGVTSE